MLKFNTLFTAIFLAMLISWQSYAQNSAPASQIQELSYSYTFKELDQKVAVQIVGTLNPLSLMIDGKKINLDDQGFEKVFINDIELKAYGEVKSFYFEDFLSVYKDDFIKLKGKVNLDLKIKKLSAIKLNSISKGHKYNKKRKTLTYEFKKQRTKLRVGKGSFDLLNRKVFYSLSESEHIKIIHIDKAQEIEKWYNPFYNDKNFLQLSVASEIFKSSSQLDSSFKGSFNKMLKLYYKFGECFNLNCLIGIENIEKYHLYDSKQSIEVFEDILLHFRINKNLQYSTLLSAELSYQMLSYNKAGHDCNFCETLNSSGLMASVYLGKRLKIYKDLEIVPQISYHKALTSMFVDSYIKIDYFSLRYYFN